MISSIIFTPTQFNMISSNNRFEKINASVKISENSDKDSKELKKAGIELESFFISYLLKEMRSTIPKSGFLSGGKAEEFYTEMLDKEFAKEISLQGGIGIKDLVDSQMKNNVKNSGDKE